MGEKQSKHKISIATKGAFATSTAPLTDIRIKRRMVQNYVVIWVDGSIDEPNKDCQNTLEQLRNVVKEIKFCKTSTKCIEILNDMNNKRVCVIASGSLGQHLVPQIHDMPQLDSIYIFCGNESRHKEWAQNWSKIQNVSTSIRPICDSLKKITNEGDHNALPITFTPPRIMATATAPANEQNLEQSEPSFT
ncbi:unnamed protein product [Rotaria sp. Silwood1]|nr:unnamed protein product [Rotaria sp. Silwood1]CAF3323193.1 unnamed protein product [Rotaria sp. Silwood1]CAF3343210.1 unnamed protein product [Rotaria sp. Silwood1]CAF3513422.1 unnamed protein product [Rotaria sp. Silwood1]CAF3553423.1 unnamed protein product [Rotaria sp. Silwood1]